MPHFEKLSFCSGGNQHSHHVETSQLICFANKSTGFYVIRTSIFNELILLLKYNTDEQQNLDIMLNVMLNDKR